MTQGDDLAAAMGPLRWGVFLVLAAGLVVAVVPGAVSGFRVTMGVEQVRVPGFRAGTLPAVEVAFSLPPASGEGTIAAWAAEQLANAIYVLGVLAYYAGLGGLVIGFLLVGIAAHRLYRSAESLGR